MYEVYEVEVYEVYEVYEKNGMLKEEQGRWY